MGVLTPSWCRRTGLPCHRFWLCRRGLFLFAPKLMIYIAAVSGDLTTHSSPMLGIVRKSTECDRYGLLRWVTSLITTSSVVGISCNVWCWRYIGAITAIWLNVPTSYTNIRMAKYQPTGIPPRPSPWSVSIAKPRNVGWSRRDIIMNCVRCKKMELTVISVIML